MKETTANGYWILIKKHILPFIGKKKLNDVTAADVQKMMEPLTSASTGKKVKHLSGCACFDAAIADELYAHPNPACDRRVVLPAQVSKRGGISNEDLSCVIEQLPTLEKEDVALLALLIMTGCRRGEALAARWEDIGMGHFDDSFAACSSLQE